jgi:hypothetical protein
LSKHILYENGSPPPQPSRSHSIYSYIFVEKGHEKTSHDVEEVEARLQTRNIHVEEKGRLVPFQKIEAYFASRTHLWDSQSENQCGLGEKDGLFSSRARKNSEQGRGRLFLVWVETQPDSAVVGDCPFGKRHYFWKGVVRRLFHLGIGL